MKLDLLPGAEKYTVLVVDDQRSTRAGLAMILQRSGYSVLEAASAQEAVDIFERSSPDIVLLDIEMPGHDGYWAARQMRERETGGWAPIIFVSGRSMDLNLWDGVEAGGDDYLVKPVAPVVVLAKVRAIERQIQMRRQLTHAMEELRQSNDKLSNLSQTDGLTGLLNRRGLDRCIDETIAVARQSQLPLTLLLCDVDHFKLYNDSLDHQAGDQCLMAIAEVFRQSCHRQGQHAGRYGGEEFALVLSNTPKSGAMTFARALMNLLKSYKLPHLQSSTGPLVTISGGITTCVPDADTTAQGMLARADEALYVAKGRGRNRFFSYEMQIDTLEKSS